MANPADNKMADSARDRRVAELIKSLSDLVPEVMYHQISVLLAQLDSEACCPSLTSLFLSLSHSLFIGLCLLLSHPTKKEG